MEWIQQKGEEKFEGRNVRKCGVLYILLLRYSFDQLKVMLSFTSLSLFDLDVTNDVTCIDLMALKGGIRCRVKNLLYYLNVITRSYTRVSFSLEDYVLLNLHAREICIHGNYVEGVLYVLVKVEVPWHHF